MDQLLYGAAYYDEYMPYERLETDMELMRAAHINVIRVAESTWATEEPEEGVFDFTHVERVLSAARKAGISVIVGTPTYAVPPWLAARHPEVLAVTPQGRGKYGPRQNMDITSPVYLFYAERVIRRLMECVSRFDNVIGFQLDNETKPYRTCGPNVLKRFGAYLRKKFGTTEAMNRAYGFNYWSNRVDCWENLPDVTGTINGSYAAEFARFQRGLVDEFLAWQAGIVREYAKPGQFLTHNFDYSWVGHSYGVQPEVNHKSAARCLDIAGCDIYHPSQDQLTGKEIAFCGSLCRGLRQDNYLVLETECQGFPNWTPYPGQLRLQAFSHLAQGAGSVLYWHWASLHNACETYWKGVLSHDLQPGAAYREVSSIGADFARLSGKLRGLRKENRAALLVSNDALTGIENFGLPQGIRYNDVVRWMYDALYEMNVGCDVIFPEDDFDRYDVLLVPALYCAPKELLDRLSAFARQGGELIATFKTGFADENLKVYPLAQPAHLTDCFGITYDQFAVPEGTPLKSDVLPLPGDREAKVWMELVRPQGAAVLAGYEHKFWGEYAAVTENAFGQGTATYLAAMTSPALLKVVLERVLRRAGLWGAEQSASFPIHVESAVSPAGRRLRFYFNYSGGSVEQNYPHGDGTELLSGRPVKSGEPLRLEPWGFQIVEEQA